MLPEISPLWISLKTVSVATVITFVLGIAISYWMFNYQGRAKAILDALFTLPLVLPPTVLGFLLLFLCGQNFLGQFLAPLGIDLVFSWIATVIASTIVAFPLMYRTTLGAFNQIDLNLLNAARTLGASEWYIFWIISLPLARQGILAGTILAFARALGEFGATLMVAGNIPGKTQTIPLAIFSATEAGQMDQAMMWVLMVVGISLAVIVVLHRVSQPKAWSKNFHHPFSWRRFLGKKITANSSAYFYPHNKTIAVKSSASLQMKVVKENPGFTLNVDFSINNQPFGLLGSSGAGKTMTLRCLAGIETPTKGRIVLNERVLFDSEKKINLPSRQRRIGIVFQNYALFPHLTVAENIAFGLRYGRTKSHRYSNRQLIQLVAAKIALVQLEGLENRYPDQLSGGQQQRVALARALAIEPDALLLDEPLSALDSYLRSQIRKQLTEIISTYDGVTIFVTHNLEEAYRICQNLLILSQGKMLSLGSKADIFERPTSLNVARLTECKNFSRVQPISTTEVEAIDWHCSLKILEPVPNNLSCIGIRAHHLMFLDNIEQENSFACWLVSTSEAPHSMTLFLKLHSPPKSFTDIDLQAEVSKAKWNLLKNKSLPLQVYFDPLKLLLLKN